MLYNPSLRVMMAGMNSIFASNTFLYIMLSGLIAFPAAFAVVLIGKHAMKMEVRYNTAYLATFLGLILDSIILPEVVWRLAGKFEIYRLNWQSHAVILLAYIGQMILFRLILVRRNHETIVFREACIFALLFLIVMEHIVFIRWAAVALSHPEIMWQGYMK